MASIRPPFIALFLVLSCSLQLGDTVFLDVQPSNFTPGITDELQMSCNIKSLLPAITDVFVIQIDRKESGNVIPVATVSASGVVLNSVDLQGRLSVLGDLNMTRPSGPFLNITIDRPKSGDAGTYVCAVSVTDKSSALVKLQYEANVTSTDFNNSHLLEVVTKINDVVQTLMANNTDLAKTNAALTARLDKLEKDLEAEKNSSSKGDHELENQLAGLTSNLSTLAQTVALTATCCSSTSAKLDDLILNQTSMDNQINRVGGQVGTLGSSLLNAQVDVNTLQSEMAQLTNRTAEQYTEISLLQSQLTNTNAILGQHNTAFSVSSAFIPPGLQSGSLDKPEVVFKQVIFDPDHLYNTNSGRFIAPRNGAYLLSLSLSLDSSNQAAVKVGIEVGGSFLTYTETSTNGLFHQGSTSAVVHLNKGDIVGVKVVLVLHPPFTFRDDSSVFTGVFLGDF